MIVDKQDIIWIILNFLGQDNISISLNFLFQTHFLKYLGVCLTSFGVQNYTQNKLLQLQN